MMRQAIETSGNDLVPTMLAAGFVTPAFAIAGAALIAIPIIIHILNRRRYKVVTWAAMDFLLAAMRKNRRRLRFESWLLLAVRCALIGLLGLALARPLGCADSTLATIAGKKAALHVIVIDNSFSMAYEANRPDAKTHLDHAKILAKRLVDRLSGGSEAVILLTASSPASAVIAAPSYDLQAVKSAIDRVEQSYSGTDLPGALRKAREIAETENRLPEKVLYLITDGTRSALEGRQAEGLAELSRDLSKHYSVTLFALARADQSNVAVLDVTSSSNLVRLRFPNDLLATARGYGNVGEVSVQWKIDDQLIPGIDRLQLTPNSEPLVKSPAFSSGGARVVSVSLLSDDRLKIDDTRMRVVDVSDELRVLIVEGERGPGALSGSGSFLELALAPPSAEPGRQRSASYVAPELISDLELGNRVLGDYRAVILAGVASFTPAQAEQLQRYVDAGGTLIFFMGESVSADAYNSLLAPHKLLPGVLTKRMTASSDQRSFFFDFKPAGNLHPFLSAFRNRERTGLDTAQVFTYWQIEVAADARVQRVLNFLPDDRGRADPAITLHEIGDGRVLFVATTANPDWTTLPAKPAYVTLVHELLAGSVVSGDYWMNRTVGDVLEVPSYIQFTIAPTLRDSAGAEIPLEEASREGRNIYRSRPLTKPGLYSLSTGKSVYPIVVGLPREESDVRAVDQKLLRQAMGEISLNLLSDDLPPIASSGEHGSDYGWSIMFIVLMLVALECFLAMRFGHYRRQTDAPAEGGVAA